MNLSASGEGYSLIIILLLQFHHNFNPSFNIQGEKGKVLGIFMSCEKCVSYCGKVGNKLLIFHDVHFSKEKLFMR